MIDFLSKINNKVQDNGWQPLLPFQLKRIDIGSAKHFQALVGSEQKDS